MTTMLQPDIGDIIIIIIIIIIITNEKIKVTLSRKPCRGTLQDYNKGEISKCQSKLWTNINVFSWCLNGTREETVRRDGGRLFHARGAATAKARSRYERIRRDTVSCDRARSQVLFRQKNSDSKPKTKTANLK